MYYARAFKDWNRYGICIIKMFSAINDLDIDDVVEIQCLLNSNDSHTTKAYWENYFEIEIEMNDKYDSADPWYVGN